MTRTARIAVLASGGGSNLQSILDFLAARPEPRGAEVVVVASDRPDAGALERARKAGIPAEVLRTKKHPDGRDLMEVLASHRVDFIALAGYLRLLPKEVVAEFPNRVVNVHPALLPAFGGPGMYGERVHRAVLACGATVSGATVHYVDEEYDHGAILAQWPVPVLADDSAHTLAARVLKVEHVLYPRVVEAVATRRWRFDERPRAVPDSAAFSLMHWDEKRLVQEIEAAFGLQPEAENR
jgi:phosphoribosylglycinamide formyltransferase-1